jgi:L-serine kinase (ADP)
LKIELVDVSSLRHIEGFSKRRVAWLRQKMQHEGIWSKPVALDDTHNLVLDGQHRMEVALDLGLKRIPAVRFPYAKVVLWSLRPKYNFDWRVVTERALSGDIYPYKTVKHCFPEPLPACSFSLKELRSWRA